MIFLGDIGLNRGDFGKDLKLSHGLLKKFSGSPVVANLEAVVTKDKLNEELDIMQFVQSYSSLDSMQFVNAFSLANNHINDLGQEGVEMTKKYLTEKGFSYFGLKSNPFYDYQNFRVIGAATYSNKDVKYSDSPLYTSDDDFWKNLDGWSNTPDEVINVIFLHIGTIFNAYPSASHLQTINRLAKHPNIDFILTSHSHCIGGCFPTKGAKTYFNLGDFFLDGLGNRRKKSLGIVINQDKSTKLLFLKRNNDTVCKAKGRDFLFIWLKTKWFFCSSKMIVSLGFSFYYLFSLREFFSHFTSVAAGLFRRYGIKKSSRILWVRRQEVYNSLSWFMPKNINKNDDKPATAESREKIRIKDLK